MHERVPQVPQLSQADIARGAKDQAAQWRETAGVLDMMLGSLEPGENVQTNELIQVSKNVGSQPFLLEALSCNP